MFQNFYLIDPYLLIFIFTMMARRFVYTLLRQFIDILLPVRWLPASQKIMRYCIDLLLGNLFLMRCKIILRDFNIYISISEYPY